MGHRGSSALQGRTDRSEVLLETAITQLSELPDYVDTDLQPPEVVLDSRSSVDGEDVQAVLYAQPNQGEGPTLYNMLVVPAGNSRFRSLGVRTGDIVKYFIGVDTSALVTEQQVFGTSGTTADDPDDPEAGLEWNEGFVRETSVDFPVAQVLDDRTLILARPLLQSIDTPQKIEVWRYSDERMLEIGRRLRKYHIRGEPRRAWQPTPDQRALEQILDRLNPWARQTQPGEAWRPDPLLASLPERVRTDQRLQPHISEEGLAHLSFDLNEARLLQQAVWLRDISEWARGDSFDPLERAAALFDWTVRNIQLDQDSQRRPYSPWQILMHGHGTAAQRAWIFCLLCRQQRLNVVILTVPVGPADASQQFWLPALVHDGELHLFDTRLGLPIPGPEGVGIAQLAQLRENPELLAALDLDEVAYHVSPDQVAAAIANVVASPFELSQRAKLLEAELTGENRLVISANPSEEAALLSEKLGVSNVRLWELPMVTLRTQLRLNENARRREALNFEPFAWRPVLWKARVLHFQGKKELRKDASRGGVEELIDSHRDAAGYYTSPRVRPPERLLSQLASDDKREVYAVAKGHASYWVGLLSYDEGRFETAADWFRRRTLEDQPDGPWNDGARYNLARSHEALGRIEEAIALYEQDESPQRHGNLLRARQLSLKLRDAAEHAPAE